MRSSKIRRCDAGALKQLDGIGLTVGKVIGLGTRDLRDGGEQHECDCQENKSAWSQWKQHLGNRLSLRFAESALDRSCFGSMLTRAFALRPKLIGEPWLRRLTACVNISADQKLIIVWII